MSLQTSYRLPEGLVLRRPTMEDLKAVLELMNRYEIDLEGQTDTTLNDLRHAWEMPTFSLEQNAWVIESSEGKIVTYGYLETWSTIRMFTRIRVHPEYQRKGIGTYLLKMLEEQARSRVELAPEGARVTLNTGFVDKNLLAKQIVERQGFTHSRNFWRMEIELVAGMPTAQWAEGITVQALQPGMERALYEADEEAFMDHWGFLSIPFEQWEPHSLKRPDADYALYWLAMDGEQIAGFALCAVEEGEGWVHVLGVRRQWRRKGIGLALLHHAFQEFYRRDLTHAYLEVDAQSLTGATRLYERAGMHVMRQVYSYEKELRAGKELSTQSVTV